MGRGILQVQKLSRKVMSKHLKNLNTKVKAPLITAVGQLVDPILC